MELLKQIAPRVTRAALVFTPDTGKQGFKYEPYFTNAAALLAVEPYLMTWRDVAELERKFVAHGKGNGLVVVNNTSNGANYKTLLALASQYELPAIFPYRWWAVAGGLFSYGSDMIEAHSLAASYIDRILKGASRSSLPIQQPTKYDF